MFIFRTHTTGRIGTHEEGGLFLVALSANLRIEQSLPCCASLTRTLVIMTREGNGYQPPALQLSYIDLNQGSHWRALSGSQEGVSLKTCQAGM